MKRLEEMAKPCHARRPCGVLPLVMTPGRPLTERASWGIEKRDPSGDRAKDLSGSRTMARPHQLREWRWREKMTGKPGAKGALRRSARGGWGGGGDVLAVDSTWRRMEERMGWERASGKRSVMRGSQRRAASGLLRVR